MELVRRFWPAGVAAIALILAVFFSGAMPATLVRYGPNGAFVPTVELGPVGGFPVDEYPSMANDNAPVPGFNFSVPSRATNGYEFLVSGDQKPVRVALLSSVGNLTISGNAYKPGGGSWIATSDARVKKDVEPFTDGLSKVLQLHPVWYSYNGLGGTNRDGKRYVGFIAQQAQKVLPYAVSSRKAMLHPGDSKLTDILQYDPSSLDYVLVNAIKQLSAENDDLDARISRLERARQSPAAPNR